MRLAMFNVVYVVLFVSLSQAYNIKRYDFFMPEVIPKKMDQYLCTPVKVNYTRNWYIVGFEPKASMDVAHHILIFGCNAPGSSKSVWNCGDMANEDGEPSHSPCMDGSQTIYAWGRNAPKLLLPEDVGFKVGGNSSIQYLVLQVHYLHIDKFLGGGTDSSGVTLHYTEENLSKTAGILLLGTGGILTPHSETLMETACTINEDKVLHPFAFRTHTHQLGRVVTGYKVKNETGEYEWELIGRKNPQDPQMFYPVNNPSMTIKKGDTLAARCTMFNTRDHYVNVGGTRKDEMCNFYLAYWVFDSEPLRTKYCFTKGPPHYFWKTGIPRLNNIPKEETYIQ